MLTIANIIIFLALIKILGQTNNPLYPALIYAVSRFFFGLIIKGEFIPALFGALISFVLTLIYFWLLKKTDGSIFWWVILILGLAIGLI